MILPIFGLLAFGYLATLTPAFGAAAASALASFVFYFAIPVLLFRSMATTALPEEIAWGYLGAFYGGTALAFALGFGVARAAFAGPFERHAMIGCGAAFGNSVLLGVPVVLTALGAAASLPLFLLLAFHSTLLFTTITLVLEAGGARRERLQGVRPRRSAASPATRSCGVSPAASPATSSVSTCPERSTAGPS